MLHCFLVQAKTQQKKSHGMWVFENTKKKTDSMMNGEKWAINMSLKYKSDTAASE